MAPRERKGREGRFNDPGLQGRLTGIRMPTNVPRNEDGAEDVDAFFTSPRTFSAQSAKKVKAGVRPTLNDSQVRRQPRADVTHELGQKGRKTGMTINRAPRNSDGLEDVNAFYNSSPPQASPNRKGRLSKSRPSTNNVEVGRSISGRRLTEQLQNSRSYGEDDMELETESGMTPRTYMRQSMGSDQRRPLTSAHKSLPQSSSSQRNYDESPPTSNPRQNQNTKRSRLSDVRSDRDLYDESPPSIRRRTDAVASGSAHRSPTYRSPNRTNRRPPSPSPEPDPDPEMYEESYDDGGLDEIPEEDEEEEEEHYEDRRPQTNGYRKPPPVESPVRSPARPSKGKGRAQPSPSPSPTPPRRQADYDYEDQDFGGGMGMGDDQYDERDDSRDQDQDQDQDQEGEETPQDRYADEDDDLEEEEDAGEEDEESMLRAPKRPRGRPPNGQAKKSKPPRVERYYDPEREREDDDGGVRRSTRPHIKPLEYWRNERVVYQRRQSGLGIKTVVKIPKQPSSSLSQKRRPNRQESKARQDSPSVKTEQDDYTGWDDDTDQDGLTWDYVNSEEVRRRVAFTAAMIAPRAINNQPYKFQKVFTDGDFMAGGILEIPVNAKKPLKPARDNTYMLYCSQGAVRVLVYRTTFTIANGGFFLVPRGNSYEIENIGQIDARLVFMQAREVKVIEPEEEVEERQ